MPDHHSRGVRHTRADEEPDVDDLDERAMAAIDGCTRCGHEGHEDDDCPTVVPYLLRPLEDRPRPSDRRR